MINDCHKANFETLKKAFENNDVCLLECKRASDGEDVIVLCAVSKLPDGYFAFTPFAIMIDGNPFEQFIPPGEVCDIPDKENLQ